MERWAFGDKKDELADKVLNGIKTATCYLFHGEIPVVGEKSIIIDSNSNDVCMIELVEFKKLKFNEMTENTAVLEGEGDLKEWKKIHKTFFSKILEVEESEFDENTPIVFEIFKVIKKYKR